MDPGRRSLFVPMSHHTGKTRARRRCSVCEWRRPSQRVVATTVLDPQRPEKKAKHKATTGIPPSPSDDGILKKKCPKCNHPSANATKTCPKCGHEFYTHKVPRGRFALENKGDGSDAAVEDDDPCVVCGKTGDDKWALLCDGCDTGVHQLCYGVNELPPGDERAATLAALVFWLGNPP